MNIYIKVPPRIARYLHITGLGNAKLPDGNYVAMFKQFEKLCPGYMMLEDAPRLGCAIIRPIHLKPERKGDITTPLPLPTITLEDYLSQQGKTLPAEFEEEQTEVAEEPAVEEEAAEEDSEEGGAE